VESEWRFNVWDIGLWGGPWDFAARASGPTPVPRYILGIKGWDRGVVVQILGPNQLPTFSHVVFANALHPHYPFGQSVDPD
jgi:hypothetical protein